MHARDKRLPRTRHTLAQHAHRQRLADPHTVLQQQAERLEPHAHRRRAATPPEPHGPPHARDTCRLLCGFCHALSNASA
eukprot:2246279-Prymnesium_polylepis.1